MINAFMLRLMAQPPVEQEVMACGNYAKLVGLYIFSQQTLKYGNRRKGCVATGDGGLH